MTFLPDELPTPEIANTAALIISFYPDEKFAGRLKRLTSQFPAVFWVDNTPGATVDNEHQHEPRVHYLSRNLNAGLATALNMGCEAALDEGYKWAVTFDQDSDVTDDFLVQQIACWKQSNPRTFALGCNYSDGTNTEEAPRFREGRQIVVCPTVITSGCLMSLSAWKALGGFRDDYYIDGVDHELCLRGRKRGFTVARHGRVLMKHRIGERSANHKIFPYLHPPMRKYYAIRNGIRNIIQYSSSEPVWAARKCATLAWEVLAALLFEPDKRRKSRAMFRGLHDGVRAKMGVAPDELSG